MKVEKEKIYLKEIPHEKGTLTFQYPAFRGTYWDVAEQIDRAGLKRPTSSETASLIYNAFQNKKGKHKSEIIKLLNDNWFWEFTGNLYLPKSNQEINNGVIIEHNPKITNGKLEMSKNDLIKRLQDNDSNVKFVPFGYKIDEQTVFELMKNPYIVAKYGEEGVQKIAEIASKYNSDPRLWSFDSVDEETVRMSALYMNWLFGEGLGVYDDNWCDDDSGHAFGIVPEKK